MFGAGHNVQFQAYAIPFFKKLYDIIKSWIKNMNIV